MVTIDDRRARLHAALYRHRLLWALLLGVLVADQVTKIWVVHFSDMPLHAVPPQGGIEVIPGVFNLIYAVNYGAAWGLLHGFGWLFLIVAVGAIYGIYRFRQALELQRRPYQWAFGLIIGGIIGNAIDRLVYGHVVDFLDVDLQFYRWPTFNIADSAIVLGVGWMLIFSQFLDKPAPEIFPAR